MAVEDEVSEAESSLEAEFQAAANEKLAAAAAQPASLSSLFEDEEVVEVDATVTDETLLVCCLSPCLLWSWSCTAHGRSGEALHQLCARECKVCR